MAQAKKPKIKSQRRRGLGSDPVRNALVMMSITVITIALCIGLYLQFGLAFWLALIAALAVYIALVSAHVLIRRSETMASMRHEIDQLTNEISYLRSTTVEPDAADDVAADPLEARAVVSGPAPTSAMPPRQAAERPAIFDTKWGTPSPPAAGDPHRTGSSLIAASEDTSDHAHKPQAPRNLPDGSRMADGNDMHAYWAFRPTDARLPPTKSEVPDADGRSNSQRYGESPGLPTLDHIDLDASRAIPKGTATNAVVPERDLLAELSKASVIASSGPAHRDAASAAFGPPQRPVPSTAGDSARDRHRAISAPVKSTEEEGQIRVLIDKLAADINAGRQLGLDVSDRRGPAGFNSGEALRDLDGAEADFADSIRALKDAAASMRAADDISAFGNDRDRRATSPDDAEPVEAPNPAITKAPPLGAAQQHLAAISQALATENVDVLLEPICGLSSNRAEHYEVTVRLRLASGELVDGSQVASIAGGTGLMPLLDAFRVQRTARIASKMEERQKPGSVFSQLTSESLGNDQFLNDFADMYRDTETAVERLVLAFSQADARVLTDAQLVTLRDMRDLGFRFAIEEIVDLDMNFEMLAQAGFAFVKLDAPLFLDGLPTAGEIVPPADICRHFAALGYGLIVGRIEDERQLANIVGFGAVLGQGALFGAPRPVKADIVTQPRSAAA